LSLSAELRSDKGEEMTTKQGEITLIVVNRDEKDGKRVTSMPTFVEKTVTVKRLGSQIGSCLQQLEKAFEKSNKSPIPGWSMVGITVGLAVNASGTVGVVTVGVEASIEIQFAPKQSN
jgi:hypothetical protein